jgi:Fe-S-cluster containining protein
MSSTPSDESPIAAGSFGAWTQELAAAIRGEGEADVACGTCTACCRSAQFILIGPDETDALAHIAADLLFAAPRMPKGHVLMGYDEHGRCPMLSDTGCTIYEHRPRTCRTYDCRVFPAAGVFPDEPEKADIATRSRRWEFSYADPADRQLHADVQAEAAGLAVSAPTAPATHLAVEAIRVVLTRRAPNPERPAAGR